MNQKHNMKATYREGRCVFLSFEDRVNKAKTPFSDITTEDGGQAKIVQLSGPGSNANVRKGITEQGVFVRFQSWYECTREDEVPQHPLFDGLIHPGHTYRITIEDITK